MQHASGDQAPPWHVLIERCRYIALPHLGCGWVAVCCLTWFVPRRCATAGAGMGRISMATRDELVMAVAGR